ncbi:acetyl-CoA C-acetyltransferase, partial [Mycobacterium tuberculosis]|nr:acetyl-CoA C-acetyltransferase [Mycobacterium tuberculosis]
MTSVTGREAYVIDAVRTPAGKRGGSLSGQHPADLAAHVIRAVVERTGTDPEVVADVIFGCVAASARHAGNT